MLGKLLKYEFKNTYKVILLLLGAVALATIIGFISLQSPLWDSLSGRNRYSDNLAADLFSIMSVFAIFFYIIMLVGVVYGAFIYLVVRFYKTMYTDEGYLLHTLPVTKHQILISKIFVSSIWLYLIYIAMYASLAFFIFSLINVFTSESMWMLPYEFRDLFQDLGGFIHVSGELVSFLVLSVLAVPASVITFYGAVSMGQLFSKHRVLMAIVSYIAIMVVSSVLRTVLQGILGAIALASTSYIQSYEDFEVYMLAATNSQLIASLLVAAGCYIASYYITSRNLNLN